MRNIFVGFILFILSDTQYFRGPILLLLSNTQYFPGLQSAYTQHDAEISGDRHCLYYAIRKYFREVDTAYTQHFTVFPGVDTAYTLQYAAFFAVGFFLHSALRRNSEG